MAETPGSLRIEASAPTPLTKVGIVSSAIAANTIRLARRRSLLPDENDSRNRANAMMIPMTGTWLRIRCRWSKPIQVVVRLTAAHVALP